jgi:hypothetical protein
MKDYEASIEVNGELEKVRFSTDKRPIEWLWERYGMSCYIEYVKEVEEEK